MTQAQLTGPRRRSDADAIEHARLRRAGGLSHLRIFPEWSLDCSRWTNGGAVDLKCLSVTPSLAYHLPPWTVKRETLDNPFASENRTNLDELSERRQEELLIAIDPQRELYMTTVVIPDS